MRTAVLLAIALLLGPGFTRPDSQVVAARDVGIRAMFFADVPAEMRVQALHVARRMVTYYQVNHAGDPVQLEILLEGGEDFERVYWSFEAPDLVAMERSQQQLASEEGWQVLVDERDAAFQLKPTFLLPASELGPPVRKPMHWMKKVRASYGNFAAALRHARAVADYANAKTEDTWFEVFRGVMMEPGTIYTFSDWEDPEAWRRLQQELWQDEEFLRLMEGAAGLYEDDLWIEGPLIQVF